MQINQIGRQPDDFQQPLNELELISSLKTELDSETINEVTELKGGLFNNSYKVITEENCYILKVAPVPSADVFYNERYLMQREQFIAPQLKSISSLIPEYLAFFKIGNRQAFLQPFVKGKLWHDVIDLLSDDENRQLWMQLGDFARVVHTAVGAQYGYPDSFSRFDRWSQFITDNVAGMVKDGRRLKIMCREIEDYCDLLPNFDTNLDRVTTPRLCHGDLWPRNVIIGGQGSEIHIKAVIDAERAYWGDPVSDWVLINYPLPDAFWQGYGENLLQTGDPACIAVYRGMYFILNILEAARFKESDAEPRSQLGAINNELKALP